MRRACCDTFPRHQAFSALVKPRKALLFKTITAQCVSLTGHEIARDPVHNLLAYPDIAPYQSLNVSFAEFIGWHSSFLKT